MQGRGIYSYHTCWLDFAKGIHIDVPMLYDGFKFDRQSFHFSLECLRIIHHASLPL